MRNLTNEELLTLNISLPRNDRWYMRLQIAGFGFCATINSVSKAIVHTLGRSHDIRPTSKTLRIFNRTELQTWARLTLQWSTHKLVNRIVWRLEFYVAESHEQSILGFHACSSCISYWWTKRTFVRCESGTSA